METSIVRSLENKKMKVTPQRLAILKLLNNGGHFTGEQVFTLMKRKIHGISISTVYNILEALEGKGLLNSIEVSGMKWYEARVDSHVNIFCTDRKEIIDLDIDLTKLYDDLRENGIKATKINVIAYSECKK